MCGIAGIFRASGGAEADQASLSAMLRCMAHRGPNGQGTFADGPVTMGMVRLSIIDLAGGQQPLYNEDKSIALVCNGEVYNFVELRADLEARGHTFRTGSDLETLTHLYEDHGDDFVQHLRGMYAGALWDAKRQRLVVFRDRLGEKPLYLYESDGVVVFASELRTLLAGADVPRELDAAAINDYFHFAYPVEPLTPFKHVRKLPAGHLLVLERDAAGKVRSSERSYWNLLDAPALDADPHQAIEAQLDEVSRLIIRSDVPVGVALSSGLDSSLIALLAARAAKETGKGEIHAFTVGYKGRPECDERADAKALADHLGIPFHAVEIDEREMLDQFVDMVIARDDPIADISGQGYFAVARASRQAGVPVLLLGHGGDELFWGYPWVRDAVKETERKRRLRSSRVSARTKGFMSYSPFKSVAQMGGRRPWARSLGGLSQAWPTIRRDLRSPAGQCVFYDITPDFSRVAASREWLFTSAFLEETARTPPHRWFTYEGDPPRADLAATQQIIDIYLRENGFAQGDRLTMASSVEARLPLSDYRLAETVIGLRKTQRDDHLPPKHWLRQVMEDLLPPWVLTRPKRGFSPPTQTWVASLTAKFGNLLPEGELVKRGILRAEAAEKLVREGVRPGEIMPLVFKAVVLEIWLRRVLGT